MEDRARFVVGVGVEDRVKKARWAGGFRNILVGIRERSADREWARLCACVMMRSRCARLREEEEEEEEERRGLLRNAW